MCAHKMRNIYMYIRLHFRSVLSSGQIKSIAFNSNTYMCNARKLWKTNASKQQNRKQRHQTQAVRKNIAQILIFIFLFFATHIRLLLIFNKQQTNFRSLADVHNSSQKLACMYSVNSIWLSLTLVDIFDNFAIADTQTSPKLLPSLSSSLSFFFILLC